MVTLTSQDISIISEIPSVLGLATILMMPLSLKPLTLTHNPPSLHLVLQLSALQLPADRALSASLSVPMKPSTRIQASSISFLVLFGLGELSSSGTKTFPP